MISHSWDKKTFHLLISSVYLVFPFLFFFFFGEASQAHRKFAATEVFCFGIKKKKRKKKDKEPSCGSCHGSPNQEGPERFSRWWGFTELDKKLTDIWEDSVAKYHRHNTCNDGKKKRHFSVRMWLKKSTSWLISALCRLVYLKGRCNIPSFPKSRHLAATGVGVNMWRDVKHEVGLWTVKQVELHCTSLEFSGGLLIWK